MTLEQLKSQAYDVLANIEFLQARLRELNQQIANYKVEETKEETKEENK